MQGNNAIYANTAGPDNNINTVSMEEESNKPCLHSGNTSPDPILQPSPERFNYKAPQSRSRLPTVAGNKVRFQHSPVVDLDVVCRDPEGLNSHCSVKFEDIIAEPDPTVFSFDGVWVLSYKVFTSTKLWCYRIISLICAVPAAICWGIEFACLSFCTIWCWHPSLKAYEISLWYTKRIFEILLAAFLVPCFSAMGKCLSHIVVTVKREG